MIEIVLLIAVACAVAGGLAGNRTAWVLLASVGLCFALDYAQVPFNFVIWVLIDLAVILAIIRPTMTKADCVILALFVPAWCFYLLPPDTRFWGSFAVVVAQLALTFPVETMRAALARIWRQPDEPPFDRLVAHA